MVIKITPNDRGNPVGKLADAEINGANGIAHWYIMRPALQPGQHPTDYGRIALRYILAADVELFGLFDSRELEAIHHACRYAVVSPEMSPIAVETITQLALRIGRILAQRQAEQEQVLSTLSTSLVQGNSTPVPPDSDIEGGAKVPTHPTPPTQPPAAERLRVPAWSF